MTIYNSPQVALGVPRHPTFSPDAGLAGPLGPGVVVGVQGHTLDSEALAALLKFGPPVLAIDGVKGWEQATLRRQRPQNGLALLCSQLRHPGILPGARADLWIGSVQVDASLLQVERRLAMGFVRDGEQLERALFVGRFEAMALIGFLVNKVIDAIATAVFNDMESVFMWFLVWC